MTANSGVPIDLDALATEFRQRGVQHKTPCTVVAAHREVILERVAQSMTFEGEPITVARLKILLNQLDQWAKTGQLGPTRSFETTEGMLTYTEVSERLAVSFVRILSVSSISHSLIL